MSVAEVPAAAVEAAAKYLSEFLSDYPSDYSQEARELLEAAGPHMLGAELAAEYRRGYRDGLTDRKQVTK